MNAPSGLTRRQVIRQLVLGSAISFFAGAWQAQAVLASVMPVPTTGTLKLKIPQFPVLAGYGGSVRLRVGLSHPIAVNRGVGDAFYAVSTRCQHLGCIVNAFDAGLNVIRCGCHGSTYHIDGSLAGGPAARGLDTFPIRFDGVEDIAVTLPGVAFGAQQIDVESVVAGTRRARLDFYPELFSVYRVEYRTDLGRPAHLASFALSLEGAANLSSYTHTDINDPSPRVSLYVEVPEPKGFLSLVLEATEYQ